MPPLLVVAEVRRTHGLLGDVLVDVVTDFPERFRPGLAVVWRRGDEQKTLSIRRARAHGSKLRLSFDGIETIDAARALGGGDLCVPEADAFPAPEGYYYAHEVEGFQCEDSAGRVLGSVVGLEQTAAGPMLTVAAGARETLVPWTRPIVVRVDREARRIVLDPPDGLFDL